MNKVNSLDNNAVNCVHNSMTLKSYTTTSALNRKSETGARAPNRD